MKIIVLLFNKFIQVVTYHHSKCFKGYIKEGNTLIFNHLSSKASKYLYGISSLIPHLYICFILICLFMRYQNGLLIHNAPNLKPILKHGSLYLRVSLYPIHRLAYLRLTYLTASHLFTVQYRKLKEQVDTLHGSKFCILCRYNLSLFSSIQNDEIRWVGCKIICRYIPKDQGLT